jgi:hypothetical protein
MTNITLQIDKDADLRLLLELIRRLNLAIVQVNPKPVEISLSERQRMIDFLLSYTNDRPSFGDAAVWQQQERTDRELPFLA